jgi:catechol 2,3-dioxygenase-like lactoylglutathione lyase family enzyme
MPPTLQANSVTIGTSQPLELARFYSRLLGLPVTTEEGPAPGEPEEAGWAQIRPPHDAAALTLNFEYESCYVRPVWPSTPGRQTASQHLDIKVDDLDAAVEWAVGCGAVLAEFQPQDDVRVLLDPDGHPFCLFL